MRDGLYTFAAAGSLFAGVLAVTWLAPRLKRAMPPEPGVNQESWQAALGRMAEALFPERLADAYLRALAPAGRDPVDDRNQARGTMMASALLVAALAIIVAPLLAGRFAVALVPAAVALGALLPLWELKALAARRATVVTETMPWMMQLFALALRSGAAFEAALRAYARICRDPVLPAEVGRVVHDLEGQLTREQALQRLLERCPVPSVEALVRAVASNTYNGAPIAPLLTEQAERLQRDAAERADADATHAASRMVGPLTMLAIGFVIVILAPFVAQMGQMPR